MRSAATDAATPCPMPGPDRTFVASVGFSAGQGLSATSAYGWATRLGNVSNSGTRAAGGARRIRWALLLGAFVLILSAASLTTATGEAGAARVHYARVVNPATDITPVPNFFHSGLCHAAGGSYTCANPCVTRALTWRQGASTPSCTNYVLAAINHARTRLGESPLTLPTNWARLTLSQQLFVIADLERVTAGYPAYLGLNATLSADARASAANRRDPGPARGYPLGNQPGGAPGIGAAWAGAFSVLAADYTWMYDDGWSGRGDTTANVLCFSETSVMCWGHRDSLLGWASHGTEGAGLGCTTCEMGSAFSVRGGVGSVVDLIELPRGAPPAMSFTWTDELKYFPTNSILGLVAPSTSAITGSRSGASSVRVRRVALT